MSDSGDLHGAWPHYAANNDSDVSAGQGKLFAPAFALSESTDNPASTRSDSQLLGPRRARPADVAGHPRL